MQLLNDMPIEQIGSDFMFEVISSGEEIQATIQ
jgi:hypothetical protein